MSNIVTPDEYYLDIAETRARLVGKRVRLDYTNDPHTKLVRGDEGIVRSVDVFGTVHIAWDNGSTLGLIEDAGDSFTIIG